MIFSPLSFTFLTGYYFKCILVFLLQIDSQVSSLASFYFKEIHVILELQLSELKGFLYTINL